MHLHYVACKLTQPLQSLAFGQLRHTRIEYSTYESSQLGLNIRENNKPVGKYHAFAHISHAHVRTAVRKLKMRDKNRGWNSCFLQSHLLACENTVTAYCLEFCIFLRSSSRCALIFPSPCGPCPCSFTKRPEEEKQKNGDEAHLADNILRPIPS
jgi:hypothetical protein